ncbi:MAG: hypothetical protein RL122_1264, partial [Pseudomonadota bacterium]
GKVRLPLGSTVGVRPQAENLHRFDVKGKPMRQ